MMVAGASPGFAEPLQVGAVRLRNRLIRSATYEGLADARGVVRAADLVRLYADLARGGVGAIVTGFVFVSQDGRAMQPAQAGLVGAEATEAWRQVGQRLAHVAPDVPVLVQLAHAGRQTVAAVTGRPVVGASKRRCTYFRQPVERLDANGIERVIQAFADAAVRVRDAGFAGVQVHAAHGYLIHQFLSPWTNRRSDCWGEPDRFLLAAVSRIRAACGPGFGIWVKLSGEEERRPGIRVADTVRTCTQLAPAGVDLIEVSCGSMEYALNIMRGALPLKQIMRINPLFTRIPWLLRPAWRWLAVPLYRRHVRPYSPVYNLAAATAVKRAVPIPVSVVGGMRSPAQVRHCLDEAGLDAVSLCRPLICEPDLPVRWLAGHTDSSRCSNCNLCMVYCDKPGATRCRRGDQNAEAGS